MFGLIHPTTPRRAPDNDQYAPVDITPTETQQAPAIPDAVQKRFDEMTAQFRESQRMYQESQNQNMALLAQLAQRSNPVPPPATPQLPTIQFPEGTDPSIANAFQAQQKFFQDMMAQQAKNLEQTINGQLGQVRMTQEQLQFQQVAQKYPPEVQRLGEQRLNEWRKAGLTGWNPEDALRYAFGELASTGKLPMTPQNQQVPNARPLNQPQTGYNMPFGAPPPPVQQTLTLPDALPDAVLAKMKPEAQLKYWEDRLAKTGGIDQPILNVT